MTCDHCAWSCHSRGNDMSRKVFDAALKLNEQYGETVTLGGGEPTLHKDFWEYLGLTIARTVEKPYIVTNGSMTDIAIALAKMAKAGAIGAALSQDLWHDPIEPEVIQAFMREPRGQAYGTYDEDYREIRDVSDGVAAQGRAKLNQLSGHEHCVCDCIVVEPTGKLWECGCRKVSFGTVFEPVIPEGYWAANSKCSRGAA